MVTKPRFGGVFFCLEPARQQRAVQNRPSLKPQAKLVKRATNPQATRKGCPFRAPLESHELGNESLSRLRQLKPPCRTQPMGSRFATPSMHPGYRGSRFTTPLMRPG